ncbi:MAG: flagellar basal body P-ring formation chaperone FlgA [Mariprofundaceae bacterium]|nr:flagellar basal body P-ring formation chaperone FlgA [Mariprofundaceae bacterium]
MRRVFFLLTALHLALAALLIIGPAVSAQASDIDQAMQDSLSTFFAHGIEHRGARAELKEVIRWPDTQGPVRWRLPHIASYPANLSLIAEQGKASKTRRWYVPVRVHWWTRAMLAARDIPAHTRIDASMLKSGKVDMAGISSNGWKTPEALIGTKTTRPLHAGQVLLSSNTIRHALLKSGDRVTLVRTIGGIQVTATGKVLKNAGIGDRVRVQNLRSKEVIQATILDAHTASVESGGAT